MGFLQVYEYGGCGEWVYLITGLKGGNTHWNTVDV